MKTSIKTLGATFASLMMFSSLSACGPEGQLDSSEQQLASQQQELLSCTYGSTRRVSVTDGASLQRALDTAMPGDDIVLAAGIYTRGGGFTLSRSGQAGAPITVRSASPLAAQVRSFVTVSGNYAVLSGLELTGSGAVLVRGDSVRITRNYLHGLGGIAVSVDGGKLARVDHNTLADMTGRGVSVNASSAATPVVERNHFLNWVGPFNENVHEAVQLGMSDDDSDFSLGALLQYNLFENVNVDQETVSVKSSDNLVRFNFLKGSRNITNRHGEDNLYIGNSFEDSEGLNVHDQNNELRANKCVRCRFGFRVMAGGNDPSGTIQSPAPYARNTVLRGNQGTIIVGHNFGNTGIDQLPRNTSIDRASKDSVVKYVSSVTYSLFDNTLTLPSPVALDASDVGYNSGSCD